MLIIVCYQQAILRQNDALLLRMAQTKEKYAERPAVTVKPTAVTYDEVILSFKQPPRIAIEPAVARPHEPSKWRPYNYSADSRFDKYASISREP